MALAENQLLMLNILMFTDYIQNGDTVKEIVCRIEFDLNHEKPIKACRMSSREWHRIIDIIKNQPDLLPYCVQHYGDALDVDKKAACFVDDPVNPQNVNIVFRGTYNIEEFRDNGMGCCQTDTQKQLDAAEYVNGLPGLYGNNMTVTGHSKGGNKAQYVTIATNRIGRCISFDSQGFSVEFLEKYAEEISEKSCCITAINAAEDYVNGILCSIPCKKIFLKTDIKSVSHFIEFHKPNILFDENGELNHPKEQSEFSKKVNEYTTYVVSNFDRSKKYESTVNIIAYIEKVSNIHRRLSRRFIQPIWDFFIVFSMLFIVLPCKMPSAIGKGLRLLLSYISANMNYLRDRRQVL